MVIVCLQLNLGVGLTNKGERAQRLIFNMIRSLYEIAPFVCLSLLACGHGPPEGYAEMGDFGSPPGHDVAVALRSFSVIRHANGLNALPDGGISKTLDGGVEINLCTAATPRFIQIAVIHEPPNELAVQRSTPFIVAWRDTAVLVTRYSGGDTLVRLPANVRVGTARREKYDRTVVPACQAALKSLQNSQRMPDGSPIVGF
jgi:hypothetical protein